MRLLAFTCMRRGRYGEAEALGRNALEIQMSVLGKEHPETIETMLSLGELYIRLDRFDQAETLTRETLEISRRVRGQSHQRTNDVRYNLACLLAMQNRSAEAILILQNALDNGYRGPKSWNQDRRLSIRDDPDLTSLHGDPEFEEIVEELRRRNEDGDPATVE
jgi:tetratricopeptide (TPR) repeat protein